MEYQSIALNCRACQDKTQEESQIFIFATTNLPDIYQETTSLDIHENDGLPKVLCFTCYNRLLEAYNFRKMCSAAVLHFQQILSMDILEAKYTPPDHVTNVQLMETTLIDLKTDPNVWDAPKSPRDCLPDREDSPSDISDKLSIDSKLPGILKTEPDDDALLIPGMSQGIHNKGEETPKSNKKKRIIIKRPGNLVCSMCNSRYQRKSSLEMHMRKEHLGLKPCQCKICGKEFQTSSSLRIHSFTHDVDEAITETQRPMRSCTRNNLSQHMMMQEGNKNYVCAICGIEKITTKEMKSHMNTHKEENMWSCEFCPYKSVNRGSFIYHVKVVHQGVKDFRCPRCERYFTSSSSLKHHMLRHEGIKNHVCTICGVKKVTIYELRSHMNTHTKEKILSCEFCPYKCSLRENLKKHVKVIHQGVKDYHCSQCDRSFGTACNLKNHEKTHTGEKPHACSKCTRRFTTIYELKTHMNIHTGENIFSCEFCPYKTIYRMQIRRHIKVVHQGVKDFHCPHCDRSFGTSKTLQYHVMTHTGERPHACSECGKGFITKAALKVHAKAHLKSECKPEPNESPK